MTFHDLALTAPLQRAVEAIGYDTPTPIQQQAIPAVLAGRDLLGCAQTGTGKTAAFALPLIQLLDSSPAPRGRRPVRALILTPTRELAIQIDACCRDYARFTRIRHTVIFGGVSQRPQVEALQQGVDLLVATPGRLLDLLGQGCLTLDAVRHFVLDEADRMLDMGFIHDIKRLLPLLPRQKQTLLFSATMPADIAALAEQLLHDPVHVTVTPPASRLTNRSLTSFKKEFRRHFEMPPHKWYIRQRLMHSRLLLISTSKSISERGVECTFPTPSHFIKLFKKEDRMTPAAYRSRHLRAAEGDSLPRTQPEEALSARPGAAGTPPREAPHETPAREQPQPAAMEPAEAATT